MTIKTGLSHRWHVKFLTKDGNTSHEYIGSINGPVIAKLRVIKEAKRRVSDNPNYVAIESVEPYGPVTE